MAYATTNPPSLIAQRTGAGNGAVWIYRSTDAMGTVLADNYISNASDLGMVAGDVVFVLDTDTPNVKMVTVVSVSSSGAVLSGNTQELTASGAVTAGVEIVELNHATVVIAATIADFAAHAGLFIVKDTSASGTAAHTLTLTSGTFDGTNTIATLNAPAEQLLVWVDGDGNGTIVQNTGSVALS